VTEHFDIDVVYVEGKPGVPYLNRDDLVAALENYPMIDSRNLFIYAGLLDLAEKLKEMPLPEPTS